MNLFKKIFPFILLLNSLLVPVLSQAAKPLNSIVAVINNSVITQQQLSDQIEFTRQQRQAENKPIPTETALRSQVLNHMIDNELQHQLAENAGIKIDDATLDKTIAGIAQRNSLTVEQLRERLEQENIPYAQYRQQIRNQLLINRLQQEEVASKITVSSQETTDMLAHMPTSSAQAQALYHVEDLLIPLPDNPSPQNIKQAKQIALSLLQQTKSGVSFQQLIEQSKSNPLPLSQNDLGWRSLAKLPDIFQTPIQALKPGEITAPIQAQNGFHLLHLLEIQGENTSTAPHYVTATHARHILIKTTPLVNDTQAEQRLKEIRADILRGGDFATFAEKYSQDPGSAYKGGDLGWTFPGVFDPTFETHLNTLKINEISRPFHTQFGWHIIQVLGREKKLQTKQTISREQAAQLVYQKKFNKALRNWLQQLRNQSYVKIW